MKGHQRCILSRTAGPTGSHKSAVLNFSSSLSCPNSLRALHISGPPSADLALPHSVCSLCPSEVFTWASFLVRGCIQALHYRRTACAAQAVHLILHAVVADSVERRLLRSGVIVTPRRSEDDSEDESFTPAEHVRRSVYGARHDSDDEDSDFD